MKDAFRRHFPQRSCQIATPCEIDGDLPQYLTEHAGCLYHDTWPPFVFFFPTNTLHHKREAFLYLVKKIILDKSDMKYRTQKHLVSWTAELPDSIFLLRRVPVKFPGNMASVSKKAVRRKGCLMQPQLRMINLIFQLTGMAIRT